MLGEAFSFLAVPDAYISWDTFVERGVGGNIFVEFVCCLYCVWICLCANICGFLVCVMIVDDYR